MKTPRQFLFNRHRSIQPKLDALRAKAIAELEESGRNLQIQRAQPGLPLRIWLEFILPLRRLWVGVAAAWCVIALLHVSAPSPKPLLNAQAPRPPLEMIAAFQYPDSAAMAELKPAWKGRTPGPRSDRPAQELRS